MDSQDLVYVDEFGLKGSNFYWTNHKRYNLTLDQLREAGLENDRVKIHRDLIKPLQSAQADFQKDEYELYIKEGLRPERLYKLIYDSRSEMYGKEVVDKILNIQDMPHASGKAVDIALFKEGNEVAMRNKKDDPEALILDFYKEKSDSESPQYHKLQLYMMRIMFENGFRLGKLREYFHFNYDPSLPVNY